MRNFRALLNLKKCKVMIGKHLCLSILVAGWSTVTVFKCVSDTDTSLRILLSFTKHLFAEHLRKAVSVAFLQVPHFTM